MELFTSEEILLLAELGGLLLVEVLRSPACRRLRRIRFLFLDLGLSMVLALLLSYCAGRGVGRVSEFWREVPVWLWMV